MKHTAENKKRKHQGPINKYTGQPRQWVCSGEHTAIDFELERLEAMLYFMNHAGKSGWAQAPSAFLLEEIRLRQRQSECMWQAILEKTGMMPNQLRYCWFEDIDPDTFRQPQPAKRRSK